MPAGSVPDPHETPADAVPVRRIPTDPTRDQPEPGVALCLSGGGYRAMLFHLGALWRLNELAYLPLLDRVSSVSGGSITAGALALAWPDLEFDGDGIARRFGPTVVEPIRRLASKTIDVPAVLAGLLAPGSVGQRLAGHYRRNLFGARTLADLPPRPLFVINATNVQSGVLWRFTRTYMWDYKVGKIEHPTMPLASAVAASSAFPPVLSPLVLRFSEDAYAPGTGTELQKAPFTTRVYLSDGGVYDNLGLETAWKRHRTVLVSDGGGQLRVEAKPRRLWHRHTLRTLILIDSQVRALRKRQLIGSYKARLPDGSPLRDGAYWGIRSHPPDYGLADSISLDYAERLASLPTRLRRLSEPLQMGLINWGYAICDTAMRRHVEPAAPAPSLPYPDLSI